jgi:hypothetical protein
LVFQNQQLKRGATERREATVGRRSTSRLLNFLTFQLLDWTSMSEKYFNRHEAEELLPAIEHYLEEARKQKQALDDITAEISNAALRIMMLGGSLPPFAELNHKKAQRDKVAEQLAQTVDEIQQTGCVVKDLDTGLVDFPSLRGGEKVYLCWKLGEARIGFWHGLEEGFAGRKPLDDVQPEDEPPQRRRVQ